MTANFSNPTESGGRLFVEYIDLVVAHAFLGHNDLLAAVDDKVPALVVATVFAIFDSLMLVQIFELAEVRPEHDRHLTNVNSLFLIFKNDLLDFALALPCYRTVVEVVFELLLAELYVRVDLGAVSEVAHSRLVWEHRHHAVVRLHDPRRDVDVNLVELYFVDDVLVCLPVFLLAHGVLRLLFDLNLSVLRHDVLHVELQEPVEGLNLLADQTVLLEIRSYHGPGVISVDG